LQLTNGRKERAARALSRSDNRSAAAREAGVDRSTVHGWLKDPTFAARVDELRTIREEALAQPDETDGTDIAGEAEQGLARLVPIAIEVVEAGLTGAEYRGNKVSSQQHANALKTIELARKLEPAATGPSGTTLGDLIAAAESRRTGS
jgi:hypothetical protein